MVDSEDVEEQVKTGVSSAVSFIILPEIIVIILPEIIVGPGEWDVATSFIVCQIIVGPGVWDVPETDTMMMIDDVFRWNGLYNGWIY